MNCNFCAEQCELMLDVGNMPLANDFNKNNQWKKYPLELYYCDQCGLMQLKETPKFNVLFNKYPYMSSCNHPLIEHFSKLSNHIMSGLSKDENDLVVEFGCNDGIFLQNFVGKRRILGVDPATNMFHTLKEKKIPFSNSPFTFKLAKAITNAHGRAKVVFAANVVAHIRDIHNLMLGVNALLQDDGYFIFEVQYGADLLLNKRFDQIYHEHVYYYTLRSLRPILKTYGLHIIKVDQFDLQGTSIRVTCSKNENPFSEFYDREGDTNEVTPYRNFDVNVEEKVESIKRMLPRNSRMVGYGAPAKASVLCHFLEFDTDQIAYTVDNTPDKIGCCIPGTDIQIFHPDKLLEDKDITHIFLFSWNYKDYIIEKERLRLNKDVIFISPF